MVPRGTCGVGMLAVLMLGGLAWGQVASAPFPRFRDGVAMPPEEAVKNPAFDIAKAFEAPPLDQNAAPLYLDAFFEFGGELAGCFPGGRETEARRKAALDRVQAVEPVRLAFERDRNSVSVADLDAILAGYEAGFRKLAEAQKRERCVFETGVGFSALLPHVQASRQVVRIAAIKVKRELDRGEIDTAIDDVKMLLRLVRDLQPRGFIVTLLVTDTILKSTASDLIEPIIAAPGLKPEHCDRLIAVLADHDARSLDLFVTTFQQEYVTFRVTIRDAILHQDEILQSMGLPPRKSYFERTLDSLRGRPRQESIAETLFGPAQTSTLKKGDSPPPATPLPDDIDQQLASTTPEELDRAIIKLNAYFAAVMALKSQPRLEQLANAPDIGRFIPGDDVLSVIVRECQPSARFLFGVAGRMEATVRGYEALTALRRWQLSHDGASPPDLLTACKAAGLASVPLDPFDGKPLRMAMVEGKPVVYSVGKDGKDDGGKLDSNFDRQPGDITFWLPLVPEKP